MSSSPELEFRATAEIAIGSDSHCLNGDQWWLFSHCSFTYIDKQTNAYLHISANNEKLGWPLPEQKSAMASDETQLMNSNSTLGVLDPLDDEKVDRLMGHLHTDNDFRLRWPPNTVKKSLAVYELFFFLGAVTSDWKEKEECSFPQEKNEGTTQIQNDLN